MDLAGPKGERTKLLPSMSKAWLVFACYAQPLVWALMVLPADVAAHVAAALAAEAMGEPQQPQTSLKTTTSGKLMIPCTLVKNVPVKDSAVR
jgi:hypothetical protein